MFRPLYFSSQYLVAIFTFFCYESCMILTLTVSNYSIFLLIRLLISTSVLELIVDLGYWVSDWTTNFFFSYSHFKKSLINAFKITNLNIYFNYKKNTFKLTKSRNIERWETKIKINKCKLEFLNIYITWLVTTLCIH